QIGHKKIEGFKIISLDGEQQVSSFFNYIFINSSDLKSKGHRESIMLHEGVHSKQLHSLDILLVEFLSCAFWFNPFVWLYKKQIRENHEFIADDKVIQSGIDIEDYSHAIIYSGKRSEGLPLSSGINFIHIK